MTKVTLFCQKRGVLGGGNPLGEGVEEDDLAADENSDAGTESGMTAGSVMRTKRLERGDGFPLWQIFLHLRAKNFIQG